MTRIIILLALIGASLPIRVVETCGFLPRGAVSAHCHGD